MGPFVFRNGRFVIPKYMRAGLLRYVEERVRPGDFLTAVICNDLSLAVGKADDTNIANLPAYINFLYNHAPAQCWGSKEKMERWLKGDPKEL